jgi:hypothetical protein
VTHLDVSTAQIDRAIEAARAVRAGLSPSPHPSPPRWGGVGGGASFTARRHCPPAATAVARHRRPDPAAG